MAKLGRIVHCRMREFPASWRMRMRELSFGRDSGTLWRWTFQDGSCWGAAGFESQPVGGVYAPESMVGWACWQSQEEPDPVIGVYVQHEHRGKGYARQLIAALLDANKSRHPAGGRIFAVSHNFRGYPEMIASAGFVHEEWT